MTAPESGAAPGQPYAVPGAGLHPVRPPAQPLPPVQAPPAVVAPRPAVPPVPPGPGLRPPFAAPPVRKEAGTVTLWLLLGGFALLACMVGGGIGLGGALTTAMRETEKQATTAATEYLDALVDGRYVEAYQMTCGPFRKKVAQQEYVTDKQRVGPLVDYELGTIAATREGQLMVPVTLVSDTGESNIGLVMAWEPVDGSTDSRERDLTVRVCGEVAIPAPGPS